MISGQMFGMVPQESKIQSIISVTAADDFKIDYRAAARDVLNRVQQKLVTEEIGQKVKLELQNENFQERLNAFEASEEEKNKSTKQFEHGCNFRADVRHGATRKQIQSIISVTGHQVIRNLSEPSEFTIMLLDTCADTCAETSRATH